MSAQFNAFKAFYPQSECWSEGGVATVYLPGLRIQTREGLVETNALLHPHPIHSYDSRLFVERQISAPGAKNWNAHTLCGCTWWACSWQGVKASLPWIEILANHLRAFR